MQFILCMYREIKMNRVKKKYPKRKFVMLKRITRARKGETNQKETDDSDETSLESTIREQIRDNNIFEPHPPETPPPGEAAMVTFERLDGLPEENLLRSRNLDVAQKTEDAIVHATTSAKEVIEAVIDEVDATGEFPMMSLLEVQKGTVRAALKIATKFLDRGELKELINDRMGRGFNHIVIAAKRLRLEDLEMLMEIGFTVAKFVSSNQFRRIAMTILRKTGKYIRIAW